MSFEGLRELLKNRYIENFRKFLDEQSGDRSGIRTSDITSDCLRRCYYNVLSKSSESDISIDRDLNVLNIFFQGHCYHQILISNVFIDSKGEVQLVDFDRDRIVFDEISKCYKVEREGRIVGIYGAEVPVSYKGIVSGRLDELWYDEENDELIIVDKKTVTRFPKDIYNHYRKQVSYYAVMLNDTFPKLKVTKGCLLYILNRTKYQFDVKCSDVFEIDVEKARKEIEMKVSLIKTYMEIDEIPQANPSEYECKFCPYKDICDAYKKMKDSKCEKIDKYLSGDGDDYDEKGESVSSE